MTTTDSRSRNSPRELADAELQDILGDMIQARVASDRAFALQRQGRAGTNAQVDGSEAIVVGAAYALDPATDWVVPQYRELVGLQRFGSEVLDRYVMYIKGHPNGGFHPEGTNVLPPQISLATQIPKAVGMAWGKKLQNEPGCVLTFFGDGSTSEGDFYEAGNLAGVLDAPVILFCVNNQWAISTPNHEQTRASSFASKAEAFGIPGVRIDGTDPVAVFHAVADARERAVSGAGPTLIEGVTYRLAPHTTADDPTRYVPADDLAKARERDPLVTFRAMLVEAGLWDDERQREAEAAADERVEAAVRRADETPLAPDHGFTNVFAEPTPRMVRQRAEMRRHLGLEDPR